MSNPNPTPEQKVNLVVSVINRLRLVARLLHCARRTADQVLILPALHPEVGRKISHVGEDGRQWNVRVRRLQPLIERPRKVWNYGNHQIRRVLLPELRQQPPLCWMIQPDQAMHGRYKSTRAQRPPSSQQIVVDVLHPDPSHLPEYVERLEHLLQIHQPHFPWAVLLLSHSLQRGCRTAVSAAGVKEDEIDLFHCVYAILTHKQTNS